MKKLSSTIISLLILMCVSANLAILFYTDNLIAQKNEYISELNTSIEEQNNTIYELNLALEEAHDYNFSDLTIEQKFRIAAKEYEIDYKLLFAIAKLETGNFTSSLWINNNNPGGMRAKDWLSFNSQFEGIMAMAHNIRNNYYNLGMDTPELMESKYCPDSASWAIKVRNIMDRLY